MYARRSLAVNHVQVLKDLPGPYGYILSTQDWLHIIWRIRVQLLAPNRNLQIGSMLINIKYLRRLQMQGVEAARTLYSDLNSKDKQNLGACLRLNGLKVLLECLCTSMSGTCTCCQLVCL